MYLVSERARRFGGGGGEASTVPRGRVDTATLGRIYLSSSRWWTCWPARRWSRLAGETRGAASLSEMIHQDPDVFYLEMEKIIARLAETRAVTPQLKR
jgi:hypothetical protein